MTRYFEILMLLSQIIYKNELCLSHRLLINYSFRTRIKKTLNSQMKLNTCTLSQHDFNLASEPLTSNFIVKPARQPFKNDL